MQHLAADGSGGVLNGWVYAGENPILRFDSAGNVSYYLEDASDSIRALLDTGGAVVEEYEYDGFGNSLNGVNPTSAAGGDFGFHAAWREGATGLYHKRARAYDPETGRFTSPDPAAPDSRFPETYEPYSFANNNPHLYSDPTGLFSITEISVTGAVQRSIQAFQTAVVQQAKKYAKDKIIEWGRDKVIDALEGFLPLNIVGANNFGQIGGALPGWLNFAATVTRQIKDLLPIAEWLWIEVPIYNSNGLPKDDGINVGRTASENIVELIRSAFSNDPGVSRPDYLIRGGAPTDPDGGPTWIIGDFSVSAQGLITKYINPGDQIGQWHAITRHARGYGIRTAVFITWNPTSTTQLQKLLKERLEEGELVFVVSLRD